MSLKPGTITKLKAVLEIDHDRGVVYVHLASKRDVLQYQCATAVRIGGLGKIPALFANMIDVDASSLKSWVPSGPYPEDKKNA